MPEGSLCGCYAACTSHDVDGIDAPEAMHRVSVSVQPCRSDRPFNVPPDCCSVYGWPPPVPETQRGDQVFAPVPSAVCRKEQQPARSVTYIPVSGDRLMFPGFCFLDVYG